MLSGSEFHIAALLKFGVHAIIINHLNRDD
jgi:hypothetical protein